MDTIRNPFSPGAGAPPPELVGRNDVLEQARILLGRIHLGRPEKSILLTGLRGVGKTVLLNEMERMALDQGFRTILVEAHENKSLASLLAPHLKKVLFDLDRMAGVGNKARRALAVLKSFMSAIKITAGDFEFGLDIDPEQGSADSGDLETDLPSLFVALGEAAKDQHTLVAILIDEIQYFKKIELSALIMAMHKIQQRQLPIVLFGAGLPILPGLAGNSKSYAERLFSVPDIGPLSREDAEKALQEPLQSENVIFQKQALDEIFHLTKGYPYFIQEWGYQAWNYAKSSPITEETIREATPVVIKRLDENFFKVRFDRLTPKEKGYLRAMAELGPATHKTSEIAEHIGAKLSSMGPLRAKLINKGMIYSPAHGDMAFTVPLFDMFMRRAMPNFPPPA
jgi:hypothetical protein